jgi:hypothetical protein
MQQLLQTSSPYEVRSCHQSGNTECEAKLRSSAHFDYTGTYKLIALQHESAWQTVQLPIAGSITFDPVSDDVYNLDIRLTSRICGRIHVAPNNDESADADMDGDVFDNIVSIDMLGRTTGKVDTTALPDIREIYLANILLECDMIRFLGERLVLEGPSGAIECTISHEDM